MSETRQIAWSGAASRRMDALSQSHPKVAAVIVEFVYGPLADNAARVGKPLVGQLDGRYSARRGDYRIIYRIEHDRVVIEAVGHRGSIYRNR